jgi:alpha-methylacyl-CoA racemase
MADEKNSYRVEARPGEREQERVHERASPSSRDTVRPAKAGPLRGLRVVEFTGLGPAPFASMLLADLGADVVRIDRRGRAGCGPHDITNRGRRCIELDLKAPPDVESALHLVEMADVLIEGFRPGVMERLGLGPDIVLGRNPRLVYARMTGWGQTGPLSQAAGHDINYIAVTGALAAIGEAGGRPMPPLNLVGDYGGGALYLVVGILAGVLSCRETGRGQVIDCAMCDGVTHMLSLFHSLQAMGRWSDERESNLLDGGAHFYGTYACADGRYISVGALEPQFYAELCRRVGFDDPPGSQDAQAMWPDLRRRMAALFKQRTRDEWCTLLEGTDACFAPVMSLSEAPQHHHLKARRTHIEVAGVVQSAPVPRFSLTEPSDPAPPPESATPLSDILRDWETV